MTDIPPYRLYTSEQAANRVGGDLVASLFDSLATSGEVEHTDIGRKIRWTDAQIAAAVAHHARGGRAAVEPVPIASAPRASRSRPSIAQGHGSADLSATPGRRYATS